MRNIKPGLLLLALSLALAIGCGRNDKESDRVVVESPPAAEETTATAPETRDPEIPQQQVEIVEPEPGPDRGVRETDLDARERELERRQAELDARERSLRSTRPQPPVASKPKPKPAPAPVPDRTEPRETDTEEIAEAPAPAPEPDQPAREERPEPEREPVTSIATVPAGTQMRVEFLKSLSSQTSEPGDIFRARVASDITDDGGRVIIPAGSEVVGVVGEAVPLRKVGGQAKLTLRFTDLVLPSGNTVPIQASFVGEGRSETRKDAATIGGAAAGGAILGRVLSKGNRSKGAVIGAIIGAAAGTAIASRTPGEEVTIDRGTTVDLKLDREVEVRVRR
ncbi:MAG TPA: TrbI/VirB10 family protein [Thermoanaerobaculia bacterium]|jgi:type IV secretory pathway VirB10-like protein|nr:TrbI/VirB10 family protein [Thermoanaerobaculia bacterium]